MERPTTPREKVIRCVTLQLKSTCEKRKQRIQTIKDAIIQKENARIDKYHSLEKTKEMYKQRDEINKQFLNII
jgi:hypothetical protein